MGRWSFRKCFNLTCVTLVAMLPSAMAAGKDGALDRYAAPKDNRLQYTQNLEVLEAATSANYQEIRTWAGTYELVEAVATNRYTAHSQDAGAAETAPTVLEGDIWIQRKVIV